MDIINHLERTVTPAVLGDNRNTQNESLLRQFYALFSAKLADKATYSRFEGQDIASDDTGFYDNVWTDANHKQSIARELAASNQIDESTAQGFVASAAPLVYREVKSLAGSTPVPQFLQDNLSTYRDQIPYWATTIVPAGVLTAEPAGERLSDTTSTAPLVREEKKEGSFLKALLPIIGLIILGALAWALLRGCEDKTQPVATPVVTTQEDAPVVTEATGIEPAALALATGEGNQLYACRVSVGNDELGNNITSELNVVFASEAEKCRVETDNSFATDMPAAQYLGQLLPLIKESPNANVIIKGDTVLVNSPDDAELSALVDRLQAAAPSLKVMAEGPLDLQGEIDRSIADANTAIDALGDTPDPYDLARALSRQVINFEFDESFIPDVNKPLLNRAVDMMKKIPDMELLIVGHTDAIGSNDYNIPLSQRRAQSVREYMISQGADASKLKIKGMGESDPIATNETDQGRFRNRRIEYIVYDESMGIADAEGIIVAPDSEIVELDVINLPTTTNSSNLDPDLNPLDNNNDDVLPDGDDTLLTNVDPDLNPLDNNNDDVLPDGDDTLLNNIDPDLNPLDNNNDDILPDSDDTLLTPAQ